MMNAIGVVESSGIAKGIELCDMMVKASSVTVLDALPMCPGKYVIIIAGKVADVQHSVDTAAENAGSFIIDKLVIPNIDAQVIQAVNCACEAADMKALGIIETFSVASGILAADAAVKTANIELMEIRLARGLGGKSFVTLTGSVADVDAAVRSGCAAVSGEGLLAGFSVIPAPHGDLKKFIL